MKTLRRHPACTGTAAGVLVLAVLLAGCSLGTSGASAPTSTIPSTAFRTIPVSPPKPTEAPSATQPGATASSTPVVVQQNIDPKVRTVYTVVAGDAPAGIARKYGVPLAALLEINGIDPKKPAVFVGQKLKIPRILPPTTTNAAGEKVYVVVSGDSLLLIANKFGIQAQVLLDLNGLTLTSNIRPGQEIKLPAV